MHEKPVFCFLKHEIYPCTVGVITNCSAVFIFKMGCYIFFKLAKYIMPFNKYTFLALIFKEIKFLHKILTLVPRHWASASPYAMFTLVELADSLRGEPSACRDPIRHKTYTSLTLSGGPSPIGRLYVRSQSRVQTQRLRRRILKFPNNCEPHRASSS